MPTSMLVAGPNLTIDRTASLEELRPGAVLRFSRVVVTPGGKGLNVARAARALGVDALLVGFVPGETGRAGAGMIAREGIELRAVPCGGELRSTAIVMERGGRTTVFNEPGPEIGAADWEAYEAAVMELLPAHGVLVCSGSVPPGSPDDAYGRLARLAARAGRPCVVDAGGVTLARAVEAGPDVVCPNLVEAEEVVGRAAAGGGSRAGAAPSGGARAGGGAAAQALAGGDDAVVRSHAEAAAAALVARGARAAVVTADAAGAALATAGGERAWLPAPRIAAVRNPVGAGDVFGCGLAAAIERGEPLLEAVRRGIAAAAASVEWPTAGELDPLRAAELFGVVAPAP
jgi:1-phosphofructokinase family hexose kinase